MKQQQIFNWQIITLNMQTESANGGVSLYIKKAINYKLRQI